MVPVFYVYFFIGLQCFLVHKQVNFKSDINKSTINVLELSMLYINWYVLHSLNKSVSVSGHRLRIASIHDIAAPLFFLKKITAFWEKKMYLSPHIGVSSNRGACWYIYYNLKSMVISHIYHQLKYWETLGQM